MLSLGLLDWLVRKKGGGGGGGCYFLLFFVLKCSTTDCTRVTRLRFWLCARAKCIFDDLDGW